MLVVTPDGEEVHRIDGYMPAAQFLAEIDRAFGALHVQRGLYGVAGAIAVSKEHNLALKTWGAVAANVELPFSRRVAGRKKEPSAILAARLLRRNCPEERCDAIRDRRGSGRHGFTSRAFHLEVRHGPEGWVCQGGMSRGVEKIGRAHV